MKMRLTSSWRRRRHCWGMSLIECLVYISATAIVFGAATTALYRTIENTAALHRAADEISRTIAVGELWRKDVRAATQELHYDPTNQILIIPHGNTEVAYQFITNEMRRRDQPEGPWAVVLTRVASSQMLAESRTSVPAWRWELELQPHRQSTPTKPLFSFIATPFQP